MSGRRKVNLMMASILGVLVLIAAGAGVYLRRQQVLLDIIKRLSADSRAAEVIVTEKTDDPYSHRRTVTLKFMEYDALGRPLEPKFLRFPHDIIQFQALVIRFDDFYIRSGDALKGKSAFIFTKAFSLLDDGSVKVVDLNEAYDVPTGYRLGRSVGFFERKLWNRFWDYALNAEEARGMGIKNAQIEAPGTKFKEGVLYTIKIEHDGGLRIDTQQLSGIFSGERLEF